MKVKSLNQLPKEQQDLIVNNIVEAVKILYESVKQRKVKEFLDQAKKERKIMENINEFKSSDFYQSVILVTVGFPLVRLERNDKRFFTFVFNDPEEKAEEIIKKYWNKELQVVARDLIESINELKTRIHSGV